MGAVHRWLSGHAVVWQVTACAVSMVVVVAVGNLPPPTGVRGAGAVQCSAQTMQVQVCSGVQVACRDSREREGVNKWGWAGGGMSVQEVVQVQVAVAGSVQCGGENCRHKTNCPPERCCLPASFCITVSSTQ